MGNALKLYYVGALWANEQAAMGSPVGSALPALPYRSPPHTQRQGYTGVPSVLQRAGRCGRS